jgi:hypothetical protein
MLTVSGLDFAEGLGGIAGIKEVFYVVQVVIGFLK